MNLPEKAFADILGGIRRDISSPKEVYFLMYNRQFHKKPVPAEVFITSKDFLNCPEAWPEILKITNDLLTPAVAGARFSDYTEAVFDAGIGSGKSFFVSFVFCYVVYWLSCLRDPQAYYGLAPKSFICLVNASTTANQAKRVVFGKIQARIDSSPYFQQCFKPDPNIRSELRFPKNIVIFPGSSSETAPIGYDVLLANVDEASFFVSTDARDSAAEVFDTLERRIRSRFEDRGLILTTSSPRYVDDFTEKKYEESKTNDLIYGTKKAVWETKPRDVAAIKDGDCFELMDPGTHKMVRIPNTYSGAFKKNPKKAWRDYGARASLALEAFFTDDELAKLSEIMSRSKIPRWTKGGNLVKMIKPIESAQYFAHIDLGLKRDACGVAIGHLQGEKAVIDFVLRIVCKARSLELDDLGEEYDIVVGTDQVIIGGLHPDPHGVLGIIYQLSAAGFLFGHVGFDGFQSAHSIQQLLENNFPASLVSVDRNTAAYDTFKSFVNLGQFDAPNHGHVMKEARRLELIDGRKVDHPKNASKDLTDAIAGVCLKLAESRGEETEAEETVSEESFRIDIQPEI